MTKLRINIAFVILFFSIMATAQSETEVPQQVKVNFTETFISASTTTWSSDQNGNYAADFMHQSQNKTALYSKDGAWLLTETRLFPGQTPPSVLESLSKSFKAYDIQQIKKIETLHDISFKFQVRVKNSVYEIEIDLAGKIRSKRKIHDVDDVEEEQEHDQESGKEKGKEKKLKKKEKHKKDKNEKDYSNDH